MYRLTLGLGKFRAAEPIWHGFHNFCDDFFTLIGQRDCLGAAVGCAFLTGHEMVSDKSIDDACYIRWVTVQDMRNLTHRQLTMLVYPIERRELHRRQTPLVSNRAHFLLETAQ